MDRKIISGAYSWKQKRKRPQASSTDYDKLYCFPVDQNIKVQSSVYLTLMFKNNIHFLIIRSIEENR